MDVEPCRGMLLREVQSSGEEEADANLQNPRCNNTEEAEKTNTKDDDAYPGDKVPGVMLLMLN